MYVDQLVQKKLQTLNAKKKLQKTNIRKSGNTTKNTLKNQSQLPKPWDDKKISIFKRQSDQQNVFSNGFFAQNALNDSCLWMNCLFLATFGYGYVYNLISKTLSSYNDKKKNEKTTKHARKHFPTKKRD